MWPIQNVSFCKIKSISEFYDLSSILESGKWIFRGQENSDWLLSHSLERMWKAKEDYIDLLKNDKTLAYYFSKYINENGERYSDRYKNEYIAVQNYKAISHHLDIKNIEALCNLQHYEGKTRLLDFTFSIGVALYFAFENKYLLKNGQCCKRSIWAINYEYLKDALYEPFNIYCQKRGINDYELKQMPDDKFNDILEDANSSGYLDLNEFDFRNLCIKKADCCICETKPDESQYKDKILPIEMPGINPRLEAQNGLFLFPTEMIPFSECLCKTFNLTMNKDEHGKNIYFELDEKHKESVFVSGEDILKKSNVISYSKIVKIIFEPEFTYFDFDKQILKAANINARNIYPDDIGKAKSIEYW